MAIAERIQKQLNAVNYTAWVFVDLKEWFDMLNHSIPLEKCNYYTMVPYVLLKIGFVHRQSTKNNMSQLMDLIHLSKKKKKKKTIATGVPRGSVSRSLLFLVHINDLCKSVKYYHY